MATQIATDPPTFEMASDEQLPFTLDLAAQLGSTEAPSNLVVTLTDYATGVARPTSIIGTPGIVGDVLNVTVGALAPGHVWMLRFNFAVAVGKTETDFLLLVCRI